MDDLRTNPALLERLKAAAKAQQTQQEKFEQRVSFIIGAIASDSDVTRERVEEVLTNREPIEGDVPIMTAKEE